MAIALQGCANECLHKEFCLLSEGFSLYLQVPVVSEAILVSEIQAAGLGLSWLEVVLCQTSVLCKNPKIEH